MVTRKNDKRTLVNYENSIKKSNELSMAKLNHGLTLNQMQLLAFAIYYTQQNGITEFHKADFEKKFGMEKYRTQDARVDAMKLLDLKVSTEDLANERFKFWNVFMGMEYENGVFKFEWNPNMIPHILQIKDKYVLTDLSITSKFKSSFSWALYDFLRAHYGYWHKIVSKDALMRLFSVEDKPTYINNTGRFKKTVLDVAIEEINKYTELEVWYIEKKEGRSITAFDIHWTNGENITSATTSQIDEIQAILDVVFDDMFRYINLSNNENRERAVEIIKELESYREHIIKPVSITKEFADVLLKKSNVFLKTLENFIDQDKKQGFYNWLDERE